MALNPAYSDQERVFAGAFDLLRAGIEQRAFPGAVLAVTLGDNLVALKAAGRFTYDAGSPEVNADTIFDLASVSKIVATTPMAMVLYQRGLLDLDAPVQAIVPEFASPDPGRAEVTIRMLLAHSSGLPAYVRLFERANTREALLLAACRVPLEAAPGERTEYSDIGFILLGEALARLAGEPLDSFCQREIFGPLGLAHTGFNPPHAWRPRIPPTEDDGRFRHRVVQGEVHDENAWVLGGVAGHAGVFAPARDVARFAHAVFRGGRPILRPETLAVFAQPQAARSGEPRALGFDVPSPPSQSGRYFSRHSFGHLGFTGTSLWIDPERGLSVTLLTNRTWPNRASQKIKRIRPALHDAVGQALGLDHRNA